MHPAFSVIVFTTASGAGYGLLVWLGVFGATGLVPLGRLPALAALILALALVTVGLLSSMLHLGHPERAWRALSQWRTSWLSREGVAAFVTYAPAGLLGLGLLLLPEQVTALRVLSAVTAVSALATIYCTAMIYASLRTIHQWSNSYVVVNYFALGLFSGALLLAVVLAATGSADALVPIIALAAGAAALAGKLAYWRFIDTTAHPSTAETATGLGRFGTVRLFEAPHTEDNYLMREMGFRIARKHATKLRRIALVALFGLPSALLVGLMLSGGGGAAVVVAVLAVVSAAVGLLTERWLFFAEAKHTVTLYYGARVV